jgi:hypothetical protein
MIVGKAISKEASKRYGLEGHVQWVYARTCNICKVERIYDKEEEGGGS